MNGELTGREREVWDLFENYTQADIADLLGISRRTVELHCRNARAKLGIPVKYSNKLSKTYVISASCGLLKIGRSATPKRRLVSLQTCMPFDLKLEHVISRDCEAELQRACKAWHTRGEWFRDCPEIREVIARYL